MFIWSDDLEGKKTFPEIAKTGANVVRIVWLSDDEDSRGNASRLELIVANCIENNMIPMIELHGATGKWDLLQNMVDYWVKPEVVAVIKKYEKFLLLNIANECGDHGITEEQFREGYSKAIERIRNTGVKLPIVIDASSWGQNIDILQAAGPFLIEQDPEKNLLFSIHMWWPEDDGSKDKIILEINESVEMELPLIVGEYAPMGVGCKEFIDHITIMSQCQKNEIGWLTWSWGLVNNADCELMDMTNNEQPGKFDGLYAWGLEVAVTDTNSIKKTSVKNAFLLNGGKCE
jgi:mannan endo-1,4-beta-mannosidase